MSKRSAKRMPKSKEELRKMAEHHTEIIEQKDLANSTVIPILTKHDLTVFKSGQVLEIVRTVMFQKMNETWEGKKVEVLGLLEEMSKDEKMVDRELYTEILTAIGDQPISKMLKLFEVLERVIDMYGARQVQMIKFTDLPINELMQ